MLKSEKLEFLTRIELHDQATATEYEMLNEIMSKEGFSRKIRSIESDLYYLPTGEYFMRTELNRDQVIAAAIKVAITLNKEYSIIVSESKGITWGGLTKVKIKATEPNRGLDPTTVAVASPVAEETPQT